MRDSYDRVARAYADALADELDRKPFDRVLLDELAAEALPAAALDVGCGPGHVGGYLARLGLVTVGLDFSTGMLSEAIGRASVRHVVAADMRVLPFARASFGTVVAFYSLIHAERGELAGAMHEIARVLVPGGSVLVAVHGGEGVIEADEFLGVAAAFRATLYSLDELATAASSGGLEVTGTWSRDPYPFEGQTERLYLQAIAR